jgi:hypothetical protein
LFLYLGLVDLEEGFATRRYQPGTGRTFLDLDERLMWMWFIDNLPGRTAAEPKVAARPPMGVPAFRESVSAPPDTGGSGGRPGGRACGRPPEDSPSISLREKDADPEGG